jgi:pyrroline-5-carboxylate reductase
MESTNILFLGAGKMACAIAGGMLKSGVSNERILAYDISPVAVENFRGLTGANAVFELPEKAIAGADVIIIAVKPQYLAEALSGLFHLLQERLIISIVAGARIAILKKLTGSAKIVRVMPNTPALIGQGISAYAFSDQVSEKERALTERILNAFGTCCQINENLMDATTGLSGSGPAYVFEFIQALTDGGVNNGLPRDIALRLAAQTVAGAAMMVLQSGLHPMELRDQVTSPGGTTIRGLSVLEENAFSGIVINAVTAATERSIELGNKYQEKYND